MINENLNFNDAPETVKRAFLGQPEKFQLSVQTRLYKWTNRPLETGSGISPWWFFVENTRLPSGAIADGFRVTEERARRLGRTHRELARARGAISDEFRNTMSELLVIQTAVPAWAFVGRTSGQPEFAKEWAEAQHVILIGGAMQLWIPNLTRQHVIVAPTMA